MKYLLDTNAWLWSVLDHARLSRRARAALSAVSAQERVGLAAISLKEAAWHLARGRVIVDEGFGPWPLWLRTAASAPFPAHASMGRAYARWNLRATRKRGAMTGSRYGWTQVRSSAITPPKVSLWVLAA